MGRKSYHNPQRQAARRAKPQPQPLQGIQNKEELLVELLEVDYLLKASNDEIKSGQLSCVYLISQHWLSQWKDYVGYSNYKLQKDPALSPGFGRKKPGSMNADLVKKQTPGPLYAAELKEATYLNQVLVRGTGKSKVAAVNQACWSSLQ